MKNSIYWITSTMPVLALIGIICDCNYHPGPLQSCQASAHIMWVIDGNDYVCPPESIMIISAISEKALTNHFLVTCTCPDKKPAEVWK